MCFFCEFKNYCLSKFYNNDFNNPQVSIQNTNFKDLKINHYKDKDSRQVVGLPPLVVVRIPEHCESEDIVPTIELFVYLHPEYLRYFQWIFGSSIFSANLEHKCNSHRGNKNSRSHYHHSFHI